MKIISSISIMNLLNNRKLNNHKHRVKEISKIMNINSNNILQLGGNNIYFSSFNKLLHKLFSFKETNQVGGGYKELEEIKKKIMNFVTPLYTSILDSGLNK